MVHTITTLHLFAGGGGGILADRLLGRDIVGAIEIEKYPREILLSRQADGILPLFPIWDDVTTFRADNPDTREYIKGLESIRERLCIAGGFPCQDISVAGKGAGLEGTRSGLWNEMRRIISEIRPRFIFVENSPMLVVRGLDRVLGDIAELGFSARYGIVGADAAGAPHRRKRFWLWGEREEMADTCFIRQERSCIREGLGGYSKRMKMKRASKLSNAVVFPTPGTTGLSNGSGNCEKANNLFAKGVITEEERRSFRAGNGGQLNPDWVEWLMGWPIGWTSLKPIDSISCQEWKEQADKGALWSKDPADLPPASMGYIPRITNDKTHRRERLKALGNGQVPSCACLSEMILQKDLYTRKTANEMTVKE